MGDSDWTAPTDPPDLRPITITSSDPESLIIAAHKLWDASNGQLRALVDSMVGPDPLLAELKDRNERLLVLVEQLASRLPDVGND